MGLCRLIKGVTMGLLDKSKQNKEKRENIDLTKIELEFLLKLIANSAFQGKDLQMIYDLTVKLQKRMMK
tara:strand:+ start:106 stop:312 length:207 start_codon:yes stop_codon:yes gene_type:complete